MRPIPFLSVCTLLAACAQFPDLDAAVSDRAKAADYPQLVPAEQILTRDITPRLDDDAGDRLLARAERLRARGRILRGLAAVDEAARLRFAARLKALGG